MISRYEYFESSWDDHPDWITRAKDAVQTLWETKHKQPSSNFEILPEGSEALSSKPTSSMLNNWKTKRQKRAPIDELDDFLTSPAFSIETDDPRQWWYEHQRDFPILSKMALDILSIPAMSDEVEQVFSSSGLLISDRR